MFDELYKYIDTWDGNMIFRYMTISIFILWYFLGKDIHLNALFALILSGFIINYLNHKSLITANKKHDILNIKKEMIKPHSDDVFEHDNMVNFLYSIQDLYHYNPLQYEKMIEHIDKFFKMYKVGFIDKNTLYYNYELMVHNKRYALNELASLIYSIPSDARIREKINNATVILDDILTTYLDEISFLLDEHTYKFGYTVDSKIIDYGPKAFNEYNDIFKPYSYEIY